MKKILLTFLLLTITLQAQDLLYYDADSVKTPTTLLATGGVDKITLTWTNAQTYDSIKVYRGTSTNPTTLVYTLAGSLVSKIDTPLTEGTLYYYRLKGKKGNDLSSYSSNASDTVEYSVYAADLDGSTENGYRGQQTGLTITEYEYLRSQRGYLSSSADSVKGSYIFDNTLVNDVTQDQAATNNDLTLVGDSVFASGSPVRTGNSMTFDGTSYLSSSDADFNFGTNSFTVEVWLKTSYQGLQYAVSKHTASNNYFISIYNDGNAYFKVTSGGTAKQIYSMDKINDGKWHYVVGTCNPSASVNLYVDGNLEETTSTSGFNISNASPLVIGRIETSISTGGFIGQIANVRLSKRLLSAAEIKNNYYTFNEIGFDNEWTNAGTHSIDTTTTVTPYENTYSGILIGAGAGDTTSNYVSIPITQPLVVGDKYLIQYWGKVLVDAGETVTTVIGDKSFSFNPTTSYTRGYLHFQATANTINKPIKMYLSQAATVFIDAISIKKNYDIAILYWFKKSVQSAKTILRTDGSTSGGYYINVGTSNTMSLSIKDDLGATTLVQSSQATYNDGAWHLGAITTNWTGNATVYYDDKTPKTGSLSAAGNSRYISQAQRLTIGTFSGATQSFDGQLGEIQVIRFSDIGSFDPRTYWTAGKLNKSYTGGSISLWIRWAGTSDGIFLSDWGSGLNALFSSQLTQSADQVKIGVTYR